MTRVLIVGCVLSLVSGCLSPGPVRDPALPPPPGLDHIEIDTPTGWMLRINPDGSADVMHGAGDHWVLCPPKTFDFNAVRTKLAPTLFDGGEMMHDYRVLFWKVGEHRKTALFSDDDAEIFKIFQVIKPYEHVSDDTDHLWETSPPAPRFNRL